ncbi:hypothetical protein ACRAWB_11095 [Leifsonia poae]|uniref:hypothetical protein n=1 Tax=Leifsonia poae TaxID=110933 RepID=UPI003D69B2B0
MGKMPRPTTISTVVIGDRTYRMDGDLDDLKARILQAVHAGGGWIEIVTMNGNRTEILVTTSSEARIEHGQQEETDPAGAIGKSSFGIEDFDEYGL